MIKFKHILMIAGFALGLFTPSFSNTFSDKVSYEHR